MTAGLTEEKKRRHRVELTNDVHRSNRASMSADFIRSAELVPFELLVR